MNITEHEMRGLITGKAMPADIFVGESIAAYLVRKFAVLQKERDALAAEKNWWKPERCPITNRPFFLWIEHQSSGMVPTYGGPYDSYTIPTVDSDGEFCCERYDHDEGAWVDSECLSVRLTDDREPAVDDVYLNSVRAEGVDKAIAQLHKKFEGTGHIGVPVMAQESLAAQLRAGKDGEV